MPEQREKILIDKKNTTEKEHSGKEHSRKENSKKEHSGKEHSSKEHCGKEHSGKKHSSKEHSRKENSGKEHSGKEPSRKEHSRKEHCGKEHSRKEQSGKYNLFIRVKTFFKSKTILRKQWKRKAFLYWEKTYYIAAKNCRKTLEKNKARNPILNDMGEYLVRIKIKTISGQWGERRK